VILDLGNMLLNSEEIMKWLENEDVLTCPKRGKRSLRKLGVMSTSLLWCYIAALDTILSRRWLRRKIPRTCWCAR